MQDCFYKWDIIISFKRYSLFKSIISAHLAVLVQVFISRWILVNYLPKGNQHIGITLTRLEQGGKGGPVCKFAGESWRLKLGEERSHSRGLVKVQLLHLQLQRRLALRRVTPA